MGRAPPSVRQLLKKMRRLYPILVLATRGHTGCMFARRGQEVLDWGSIPLFPTLYILKMYHVTPVEWKLNLPPTTSRFSKVLFIFVYFSFISL